MGRGATPSPRATRERVQVCNVEEGKQGESVHPCFLSSSSRFVHSPGPIDVVSHPQVHHLQKKKISMVGIEDKD